MRTNTCALWLVQVRKGTFECTLKKSTNILLKGLKICLLFQLWNMASSICQILIFLLLACLPSTKSIDFNYPAVFNFGDSNSDTGGLISGLGESLDQPNGQTYFKKPSGRFCDGRLIIDFLSIEKQILQIFTYFSFLIFFLWTWLIRCNSGCHGPAISKFIFGCNWHAQFQNRMQLCSCRLDYTSGHCIIR